MPEHEPTDEPPITTEMVEKHGLRPDEYERILDLIGRKPSLTELGIFSAMWNEHCSYKSSKKWLRTLPTNGKQVICGPGENAGVVDIGDGQALVFKMESHNHPSYIEPYQGAATGVGGILRDVFTMGARPIATMNSLSFGETDHPRTAALLRGVVGGIGGYGNCFGVPNIGGELRFHAAYNGNCLVNAFAAGLVDTDAIFYSAASGTCMPVVYLGAKTGRDGVGGATMASAEFDAEIEEKRPTVQVGDPFTEKRLMEASLELMRTGAVISIQDMGAAGLTCSAVEMGDKGSLGIRLDLENVPVRETGMSAYEIMLSESQERMLMVLRPDLEAAARQVFEKWDLDFAIVGETIAEDRFVVTLNGEVKADLPLTALSGTAPEYDRPWKETEPAIAVSSVPDIDPTDALLKLIANPNHCSRQWVWSQYDHSVMGDTLVPPGSDAGVVRIHGTRKAIAFTSDVNPNYCRANPRLGGMQAVAEAYRNLSATGAVPLATTDNLNFGNPERPEIMGQLVGCIAGIGEAVAALDMPIVSGNVSLYNETDGRSILPTPTIGAVGLLCDLDDIICMAPSEGETLIVLGKTTGHLGQSALLLEVFGVDEGDAPPVNLAAEKAGGELVRELNRRRLIRAAHDVSDGGLALAAVEMALAGNIGTRIVESETISVLAWYYGEDQGRYLVSCSQQDVAAVIACARERAVEAQAVGRFEGGDVRLGAGCISLADLKERHANALPDLLA